MAEKLFWKLKPVDDTQLIGPFECPKCAFHVAFDYTYLDQVGNKLVCPSCGTRAAVRDTDDSPRLVYEKLPESAQDTGAESD